MVNANNKQQESVFPPAELNCRSEANEDKDRMMEKGIRETTGNPEELCMTHLANYISASLWACLISSKLFLSCLFRLYRMHCILLNASQCHKNWKALMMPRSLFPRQNSLKDHWQWWSEFPSHLLSLTFSGKFEQLCHVMINIPEESKNKKSYPTTQVY